MDFDINTKGKGLFLSLATFSLFIMMVITTLLWWFVSPRLHDINSFLAITALTSLRVFYLIVILGIVLIFMTCYLERYFIVAGFAVRLAISFLFPVTVFIGKFFGISKDKIRESFVHVNNSFVKALNKTFKAKEILILLPHCLQHITCKIRITTDISNCKKCGKCDIGALLTLSEKYGVHLAIATGGTLARKIIIETRPKFIIAVACQRDLVDGMQEVFPIPVYGVLNERPDGPCINTKVAVRKIEEALAKVIVNNSDQKKI